MGNTIDYIKEFGNYTFAEKEFNEVDSLILCQMAYFKYDGMAGGLYENGGDVMVKDLKKHPGFHNLYQIDMFEDQYLAFYEALCHSRRFRSMRLNYYENHVDEEKETQFSAVTFFPDEHTAYIAFRGTDETLVGWKEDFNMAFMYPVPMQEEALQYFRDVASKVRGTLYLGGHSKGGNAAVFTAMNCPPLLQDRLKAVYCFDGPGFMDDIYRTLGYIHISHKIIKIVPEHSLVGMLLQNKPNYKVVKSTGLGLLQHDAFTWVIEDGKFCFRDDIYITSIYHNQNLNDWIGSLSEKERRRFVDNLFEIISKTEASTVLDLTIDPQHKALAMLEAVLNMDEDTREFMRQVIGMLFKRTPFYSVTGSK